MGGSARSVVFGQVDTGRSVVPTGTSRALLSIDSEFDHEKVMLLQDRRSGLRGVIAIHSTALGPAVGGLRWRPYTGVTEAAVDALRLSRAMTLKNASANLAWGGGKACVIDDGGPRDAQLEAFARVLNELDGEYIAGKDVGMTIEGMNRLVQVTRWVVGIGTDHGGLGDPSPATARTVIGAIEAAVRLKFGSDDLGKRSVGVIGVGGVGASLAEMLAERGTRLILADLSEERLQLVASATGAQTMSVDDALRSEVDVLAPCATGEMIGLELIDELRCKVIAGGANNPLINDATAEGLAARDVLYVPDYLANSGGVIMNAAEFRRETAAELELALARAVALTEEILQRAALEERAPYQLAREAAWNRVAAGTR